MIRGWVGQANVVLCFGILLGVLVGCSPEAPAPPGDAGAGWGRLPPLETSPHPWGQWLQDRCIGLDPGHGGTKGDDGWGFEGPVNLTVALELQRFLERDGAKVVLTRTTDVEVPLARRPQLLKEAGAEVFISIHHNAITSAETNYTSTYYHGRPPGHEPADLDLARSIQARVMEALRTPVKVPVPLLSDKLVAKQTGFRVLRLARIPAVLCEASFYTHPGERQRLTEAEYLRREAYGYYLGLVDYFAGGTPRPRLISVKDDARKGRELTLGLDDGLQARGGWGSDRPRIIPSSIRFELAGKVLGGRYDPQRGRYVVTLPRGVETPAFRFDFQNVSKHSSFPTRLQLRATPSGALELGPATTGSPGG